jgi:hypothetical protein
MAPWRGDHRLVNDNRAMVWWSPPCQWQCNDKHTMAPSPACYRGTAVMNTAMCICQCYLCACIGNHAIDNAMFVCMSLRLACLHWPTCHSHRNVENASTTITIHIDTYHVHLHYAELGLLGVLPRVTIARVLIFHLHGAVQAWECTPDGCLNDLEEAPDGV